MCVFVFVLERGEFIFWSYIGKIILFLMNLKIIKIRNLKKEKLQWRIKKTNKEMLVIVQIIINWAFIKG